MPAERPAAGSVIALTLTQQIAVSLAAATFPVLLPALSSDATGSGLGGDAAGVYAVALYGGAIVATFFCQAGFSTFGIASTSTLCVLLAGLALPALLPGTLAAVILAGIVIGIGYGPTTPASSSMILPFVAAGRANFLFSLRQTGAPLGVLCAGVLIPPLVGWIGWSDTVLIVAALVVIASLAGAAFARRLDKVLVRPAIDLRRTPRAVVAALRRRPLRRLISVSCLFAAMLATVNAYIPYSVATLGQTSLTVAGWAAAAAQVGAVAGRLFWGALADRIGAMGRVLAMLGLGMAAAVALVASIRPEWPVAGMLGASFLLGTTGAGWGGLVLAEVTRIVPRAEVGTATTALMIFNYVGVFIGPPLVAGALLATGSLRIALLVLTVGSLVGATIAWFGLAAEPPTPESGDHVP
ncbi:MFS transporter [Allostella humosa]|nr:MFS transporter [Stella humosa]